MWKFSPQTASPAGRELGRTDGRILQKSCTLSKKSCTPPENGLNSELGVGSAQTNSDTTLGDGADRLPTGGSREKRVARAAAPVQRGVPRHVEQARRSRGGAQVRHRGKSGRRP